MMDGEIYGTLLVLMDTDGELVEAKLGSMQANYKNLRVDMIPDFLKERIALVKLQDNYRGGMLGRRLNEGCLVVYILKDEYPALHEIPSA